MPVYDKPMIYYPLSTLMQAGIREILLISTPEHSENFKGQLGYGENFGVNLQYAVQPSPDGLAQAFIIGEDFIGDDDVALVRGDNIFYGHNLIERLKNGCARSKGATIFGYHVANPGDYGVIEFNSQGLAISLEEKPVKPKSSYAIPGLYFFDNRVLEYTRNIKPSVRGGLEMVDVIKQYLDIGELHVHALGRGTAWFDTGTHDDLLAAAQFIQSVDKRQGLKINCPEEIAYRSGWIDAEHLRELALGLMKGGYGPYLLSLLENN